MNPVADTDEVFDAFDADPPNGAKGSDPNGSDENPSFAAELVCFSVCCLNFRLENGSNDSSRLSDAVIIVAVVVGNPPKAEANGSLEDVDDDGHADAKGSADDDDDATAFVVDVPPRRLNGSFPPKFAAACDDPKAVAIGAVNGSSLS